MPPQAPSQNTIARAETWLQGVNDFLLPDQIGEGQCPRMVNLDASLNGTLRRRPPVGLKRNLGSGLTDVYQQPRQLKSFKERYHGPVLVAISDASDGTSQVWIDDGSAIGPFVMTSPHKLDHQCDIVTMLDRINIIQPGQKPLYWEWGNVTLDYDGGTTPFTDFPSCTTACYFQSRGWAGNRDIVYFSNALGSAESKAELFTWDQQNQGYRVVTGQVVKLLPYRAQRLLIFTDGGIESIFPSPSLPIYEVPKSIVSDRIGCGARDTVMTLEEDCLWIDQFGDVRSLEKTMFDEPRGVLNEPLSLPISGFIRRQTKNRLFTSRATVYQGDYIVAWPSGGALYANEMWRYSPRTKSWHGPWYLNYDPDGASITTRVPWYIGGLWTLRYPGGDERLYVLARTAGGQVRLLQFEDDRRIANRSDVSTPIVTQAVTRAFVYRNPERPKFPINIKIQARFVHLPLTASVPSGASLAVFDGRLGGVTLGITLSGDEGGWVIPSVPSLMVFVPNAVDKANPRMATLPRQLPFRLVPHEKCHYNIQLPNTVIGHSIQAEITYRDLPADFEITSVAIAAEERPAEMDS